MGNKNNEIDTLKKRMSLETMNVISSKPNNASSSSEKEPKKK